MISFPGRGIYLRQKRRIAAKISRLVAPCRFADISLFHDFAPPPAGGGHQFLRAIRREWEKMGLRVEVNSISRTTRACLFNSNNFDPDRLRVLRRAGCRMVHRVDGPLAVYRGFDDGTDKLIQAYNHEFADASILQSEFSRRAHEDLHLALRSPVIIPNAADPELFYPAERSRTSKRLKIISTSWSDNPNKGAAVYQWLDQHLDFSRISYTFIGRLPVSLTHIRVLSPLPSAALAEELRGHDVYLTASRHDPCSNSLIEALSCGLPAIYLDSGGHRELTGEGGLPFREASEVPELIARIAPDLESYRSRIKVPRIPEIALRYLDVLGVTVERERTC